MDLADLATPMAVRVAATLGLVEQAGGAGATAEQLAPATGTVAPALRCLLDHLVTVGCSSTTRGPAATGPPTAQMHEDAPSGVTPLLDITCAGGRGELAFVDQPETVTTGASAYTHRYGREFWTDIDAEPALRRSFDAQMNWRFRRQAPQITARFDCVRGGCDDRPGPSRSLIGEMALLVVAEPHSRRGGRAVRHCC